MASIVSVRLKVGMEIHVELSTRSKMFTRAASPAHPDHDTAAPNTLIDPVVLGLPGALPVINRRAVEMSVMVGLALGCRIARRTKWDRKSYFYPDLPKNYQISQYDLPLCEDGAVDVPEDGGGTVRIGIVRAHLEEDAGKLLHEAPGGRAIDGSIIDLNRAGTPLLEIVTAPDFTGADQVVAFARMLRDTCRFLGVTEGVMQKGHMRFEPNINTICTLPDGSEIATPVVEIKNLNSFKSLRASIEHELAEQPRRFLADGRTMGPGAKSTRGWDDQREVTVLQREKEDAHDYRYFPDPDLPAIDLPAAWVDSVRARLPELPHVRRERYMKEFGLGAKEAAALVEERDTCLLFESSLELAHAGAGGAPAAREQSGRLAANLVLQSGLKRANERGVPVHALGISAPRLAGIVSLRAEGSLSAAGADELFGALCESEEEPRALAERLGLLQVRDDAALAAWVDAAIANPASAQAVADVRAGKAAAIGRLVGEVMKLSGGKAEARVVRQKLEERLRG